jgi:hypothetical protein
MAICHNCGQENLDSATQCSVCGYTFSTSVSTPADPALLLGSQPLKFPLPPGHPEYQLLSGHLPQQSGVPSYGTVPVPSPTLPKRWQKAGQFFAGLGLGLIPSVIALLLLGSSLNRITNTAGSGFARLSAGEFALCMEGVFFIFFLTGAIALITHPNRRFWGYGMLTGVLISPVAFFVGVGFLWR